MKHSEEFLLLANEAKRRIKEAGLHRTSDSHFRIGLDIAREWLRT